MEKKNIEEILKQHKKLLDQPRSISEFEKQNILNKYNSLLNQIPEDIKDKMEGVINKDSYVKWYYSPNKSLGDKSPYESPKKEVECILNSIEWGIPT